MKYSSVALVVKIPGWDRRCLADRTACREATDTEETARDDHMP